MVGRELEVAFVECRRDKPTLTLSQKVARSHR